MKLSGNSRSMLGYLGPRWMYEYITPNTICDIICGNMAKTTPANRRAKIFNLDLSCVLLCSKSIDLVMNKINRSQDDKYYKKLPFGLRSWVKFNDSKSSNMHGWSPSAAIAAIADTLLQYDKNIKTTDTINIYTMTKCLVHSINMIAANMIPVSGTQEINNVENTSGKIAYIHRYCYW